MYPLIWLFRHKKAGPSPAPPLPKHKKWQWFPRIWEPVNVSFTGTGGILLGGDPVFATQIVFSAGGGVKLGGVGAIMHSFTVQDSLLEDPLVESTAHDVDIEELEIDVHKFYTGNQ